MRRKILIWIFYRLAMLFRLKTILFLSDGEEATLAIDASGKDAALLGQGLTTRFGGFAISCMKHDLENAIRDGRIQCGTDLSEQGGYTQ